MYFLLEKTSKRTKGSQGLYQCRSAVTWPAKSLQPFLHVVSDDVVLSNNHPGIALSARSVSHLIAHSGYALVNAHHRSSIALDYATKRYTHLVPNDILPYRAVVI